MIRHHPNMQLLTDYAAGSLPFGQSLCISIHQEKCHECQHHIRELNGLGGALLEQLEPTTVAAEMLDSLMTRIDADTCDPLPRSNQAKQAPNPGSGNTPRALAKLLPGGMNSIAWKRTTSSLSTAPLQVGDDATQVSLIRMKPGGRIDKHYHGGDELTVVLKGGFSDDSGDYKAGDFVFCSRDDTHQPIAHQNEDCICLAAQDAPIKFTGVKGLILNPLVSFQPG